MGSNQFRNPNAEPWYRWLLRRRDPLPAVTIYFLSKANRTSPRFFPLYEETNLVRVVVVRGLPVPKTDKLVLCLVHLFVFLVHKKLERYYVFLDHDFWFGKSVSTNTFIQCDDPVYTKQTIHKLKKRAKGLYSKGHRFFAIVTNDFTRDWIGENCPGVEPYVIAQGFTPLDEDFPEKFEKFSCIYTSGSISYIGDKHQDHPAWNASHLIEEIIPQLTIKYPEIDIHLTGLIGKNAKEALSAFPQVVMHGALDREQNVSVLRKCHVGLHPRKIDHGWQVQKISEYIGAGIPIVSYDLLDSALVKQFNLGIVVTDADDFVQAIGTLYKDEKMYSNYTLTIHEIRNRFSWEELARELDSLIYSIKDN